MSEDRDIRNASGRGSSPETTGDSANQTAEADAAREKEVAQLRAELDEAKDRILRGLADLENYRKRANRQIDEERRYAIVPFVRDLLPVLDDVRRAIDAGEKNAEAASLLEGFRLVGRALSGVLERHHIEAIESLHKPFDPHFHEAVLQQPSKEFPPNTVIMEIRGGFKLHDRVVRPSQVIVASAPAEPQPASDGKGGA